MSEVIAIDRNYDSVAAVVYCGELHKLITDRKPFQLRIIVSGTVRVMTMPQAITILSTGKKFLDYAAFN